MEIAPEIDLRESLTDYEKGLPLPPRSKDSLRPYQQEGFDQFVPWLEVPLDKNNVKNRESLLCLAMGLGKTFTAAKCIEHVAKGGGKVLWVTHRAELLDQAKNEIEKVVGIPCHVEMGRKRLDKRAKSAQLIACTAQSMSQRRLDTLSNKGFDPELIVIDESHHSYAKTYMRIKQQYPNAKILNLTGTPYRGDIKNQMELGTTLKVVTLSEGVRMGELVPVKPVGRVEIIRNLDRVKVDTAGKDAGDYNSTSLGNFMTTPEVVRSCGDLIEKYKDGRRGVVYCASRKHARAMVAELERRHIKTGLILGSTKMADREKIYADLVDGKIEQVVNVMVLTEGLDRPAIDMITMLRPTKNSALYLQALARGIRKCPATGKTECLLIDVPDEPKRKGAEKTFTIPYPSEVDALNRESAMRGITVSMAALYLSWFYKKEHLKEHIAGNRTLADVGRLDSATAVYDAAFPGTPDTQNIKDQIAPVWDAAKLRQRWV